MDYYIVWTHSDPVFQVHFDDVRLLVSPPNVSRSWQIQHWPRFPKALILDSGAFQFTREGRIPHPEAVLQRQLQMLAGAQVPCALCHLDVPLLRTRDSRELDRRIQANLANARWLIESAAQQGLPEHVSLLGVIQGYDVDSIFWVAQALADMGYTHFALGSLASLPGNQSSEVVRRVEAALEAVGTDLHILGVSSVALLPRLARLGVRSADSSAPVREAFRGGVFYSQPFRKFKIPSPHFREWARSYSFSEVLDAPLPCDCPVCIEDHSRLLEPQGKAAVNLRAVHNYYHLTRELHLVAP